jgi:hypothetical protein
MVSVIENWTDMEGIVLSLKQPEVLKNFLEAEVTVEKAYDVEGFPNLLKKTVGKTINVFIPRDLAAKSQLSSGLRISFRARGGMREIFVHPDFLVVQRQ